MFPQSDLPPCQDAAVSGQAAKRRDSKHARQTGEAWVPYPPKRLSPPSVNPASWEERNFVRSDHARPVAFRANQHLYGFSFVASRSCTPAITPRPSDTISVADAKSL